MSKRTLLLADDSVTIQKVVNLTFADEGIDVVTVGDGDSAMQKISEIAPDVCLLDVHMPGLNGYQICESVRQNPATRELPVILLVGSFEPFDESEAARVGANAYLTKPFQSIRQLVSQVTELIESSTPASDSFVPEEKTFEETASEQAPIEDAPPADLPPIEDIESLYHESLSGPSAPETELDPGAPRYVDAGMDDEMIETSSFDRPVEDEGYVSYVGEARDSGVGSYEESDSVPGYEQRGETGDAAHASSDAGETAYSAAPATPDNHEAPTSEFQYREEYAAPEDTENIGSPALRTDDVNTEAEHAVAEPSSDFDEFSRTEQMPAFDLPQAASRDSWDQGELLELPPIQNGRAPEPTPPPAPPASGESTQVVSLSPEQMDIIVQKIVEKLSEKS